MIRGRRHGAHLRAPPAERHPPRGGAEADHAVRHQARCDRGPRGRRAGGDPVRRGLLDHRRRGVLPAGSSSTGWARAGPGGGELPLRQAGEGRPRDAAQPPGVRDRGRAAGRGRRRDRLLDPDPRPDRRRRRRGRDALPGGAVPARGDGGGGRQAGAHARLPDRERGPRRGVRLPGPRRLRRVRRRGAGGGQRGRAPDLRDRARRADRVLPDRPQRRPLRPDAADRVHRPAAGREALRGRGRAGRPDAPRRGRGPRAFAPSSHHLANLSARA